MLYSKHHVSVEMDGKMVDPQVTMGFNTKMVWSLDDLGVPPHFGNLEKKKKTIKSMPQHSGRGASPYASFVVSREPLTSDICDPPLSINISISINHR